MDARNAHLRLVGRRQKQMAQAEENDCFELQGRTMHSSLSQGQQGFHAKNKRDKLLFVPLGGEGGIRTLEGGITPLLT